MRQGPHSKRGRGRGGNRRSGTPNRNQTFDSNGPDVRIRGNAHQVHEKYLNLARDASASGDGVLAESYFQHAEHYFRILSAFSEDSNNEANRQRANGYQGNGSGQPYDGEPQPDVERAAHGTQQSSQTDGVGPAPQSSDAAQTSETEQVAGRNETTPEEVAGRNETTPEKTAESENLADDAGGEQAPLTLPGRGNGEGSSKASNDQTSPSVKVTMVGVPAEADPPVPPTRQRRKRKPPQETVAAPESSQKDEEERRLM